MSIAPGPGPSRGALRQPDPQPGDGPRRPGAKAEGGPPPFEFAVEPPSLDFGLVAPGKTRTLTAYVVNQAAQHPCLVTNVELAPGSDTAFSVQPIPQAILPPADGTTADHRLPVRVSFSPAASQSYEGEVRFSISAMQTGPRAIALSGAGGESCLEIEAQFAAFAGGRPQCSPRERAASPSAISAPRTFGWIPSPSSRTGLVPRQRGRLRGDAPRLFLALASHAPRLHVSMCTVLSSADWNAAVLDLSEAIFALPSRFDLRGRPADADGDGDIEDDIVIRVNGQRLEPTTSFGARRWRYDPATHSIEFTSAHVPSSGAQIEVEYRAGCS